MRTYSLPELAKIIVSCEEKNIYRSRHADYLAADRAFRNRGGVLANLYHCPVCGDWHLTSAGSVTFTQQKWGGGVGQGR